MRTADAKVNCLVSDVSCTSIQTGEMFHPQHEKCILLYIWRSTLINLNRISTLVISDYGYLKVNFVGQIYLL